MERVLQWNVQAQHSNIFDTEYVYMQVIYLKNSQLLFQMFNKETVKHFNTAYKSNLLKTSWFDFFYTI